MTETLGTQYSTRDMLEVFRASPSVPTFLTNLLVKRTITHNTKYIELDFENPDWGVPAYVTRVDDGELVNKPGFTSKMHLLPYTKQTMVLTPEDLETRAPGETVYEGSPQARRDQLQGQWLAMLNNRIGRLEELQLANAISNGTAVITGNGVSYTITYGRDSSNSATLTGADRWSETTRKIKTNLIAGAEQMMKPGINGGAPTDLILGPNAAKNFTDDDNILAEMDYRRVDVGAIDVRFNKEMMATYIGNYRAPGFDVDVWSYHAQYIPTGGSATYYIDTNDAVLVNASMPVIKHYSMISNLRSGNFVGERYPMYWEKQNGSSAVLQVESGPLVATHWPNSTYRIKTNG